jgi:hypothetical protein
VVLLERLAELTVRESRTFVPGDTIDPGGPIDGQPGGPLVGLLVASDPRLAPVPSDAGTVDLRTLVGVRSDQLQAAQGGRGIEVIRSLQVENPLLVTPAP